MGVSCGGGGMAAPSTRFPFGRRPGGGRAEGFDRILAGARPGAAFVGQLREGGRGQSRARGGIARIVQAGDLAVARHALRQRLERVGNSCRLGWRQGRRHALQHMLDAGRDEMRLRGVPAGVGRVSRHGDRRHQGRTFPRRARPLEDLLVVESGEGADQAGNVQDPEGVRVRCGRHRQRLHEGGDELHILRQDLAQRRGALVPRGGQEIPDLQGLPGFGPVIAVQGEQDVGQGVLQRRGMPVRRRELGQDMEGVPARGPVAVGEGHRSASDAAIREEYLPARARCRVEVDMHGSLEIPDADAGRRRFHRKGKIGSVGHEPAPGVAADACISRIAGVPGVACIAGHGLNPARLLLRQTR
ncbi:hypothetical protein BOSEA31B_14796 [Hyphomicrobiales bacterium]|nr:hypothetical protein BOSEA31B_14796 [Hyphomicrobiales bacterium]